MRIIIIIIIDNDYYGVLSIISMYFLHSIEIRIDIRDTGCASARIFICLGRTRVSVITD